MYSIFYINLYHVTFNLSLIYIAFYKERVYPYFLRTYIYF